jgi:hypothetical protein
MDGDVPELTETVPTSTQSAQWSASVSWLAIAVLYSRTRHASAISAFSARKAVAVAWRELDHRPRIPASRRDPPSQVLAPPSACPQEMR